MLLSTIVYVKLDFLHFSFSGTDDDDVILKSFDAFEVSGKIDAEM